MTSEHIPQHVAIIMDGNRRWARAKNLPGHAGHREGAKAIEKVVEAAANMGVKILTLYAFSTENWKRPKDEVGVLIRLFELYLDKEAARMMANGIKLHTIGRTDGFTAFLLKKIEKVKKMTRDNKRLMLNLAVNYGSRDEIVNAVKKIALDAKRGGLEPAKITEDVFSGYLYTAGLPDPDLLIRTGGQYRVSNFLLWQISYAELYVTGKLWPDFGKKDFEQAVREYMRRERRLGE